MGDWAKALVERRATIMHAETQVIGVAKRFYDGVTEKFTSSVNGAEVDAPILELYEGNAFIAEKEEAFVELAEGEVQYQNIARAQVDGVMRMLTARESLCNSSPQAASIILISTLTSMLNVLRAAHERRFGKMGGSADVG